MKQKSAHLEKIQRWMQSVIMHPGGVEEGVDSDEARRHLNVSRDELDSIINPSSTLDSGRRLEIYVDAYYERLLECLRQEFDVTRRAVGEDLFDALAFGYLQSYPSRSYTLYKLGERFADFLHDTQLHANAVPDGAIGTWPEFVVELAIFERVQREVFDAPGTEGSPLVDAEQLARISPEAWDSLRLITAPCLRLCTFVHPVHRYWLAWRREEEPNVPEPEVTYLAVNRQAYTLDRIELTERQFALLGALVEGQTLWDAIHAAASDSNDDQPLESVLGGWFADWTQRGCFLDIERDGAAGR